LSRASGNVSEQDIRNYLVNVKQGLEKENDSELFSDPTRSWNADETMMHLAKVNKRVIVEKGKKSVNQVIGDAKEGEIKFQKLIISLNLTNASQELQ
jgi:hypothetical protein